MEIISKVTDEVLKVSIIGDLDANGAINLDSIIKKAIEDNYYRIIVDCQNLSYISSAGLGVFISYHEDLKDNSGRFVFCNMSDNVLNVFKILGLEKIMTIAGNLNDAKKAMNEN